MWSPISGFGNSYGGVTSTPHLTPLQIARKACDKLNEPHIFRLPGDVTLQGIRGIVPAKQGMAVSAPSQSHGIKALEECYDKLFQTAVDHKADSLSVPPFSTGANGFTHEEAAFIAVSRACQFLSSNPHLKITFVIYQSQDLQECDSANADAYQAALTKLASQFPDQIAQLSFIKSQIQYYRADMFVIPVDEQSLCQAIEEACNKLSHYVIQAVSTPIVPEKVSESNVSQSANLKPLLDSIVIKGDNVVLAQAYCSGLFASLASLDESLFSFVQYTSECYLDTTCNLKSDFAPYRHFEKIYSSDCTSAIMKNICLNLYNRFSDKAADPLFIPQKKPLNYLFHVENSIPFPVEHRLNIENQPVDEIEDFLKGGLDAKLINLALMFNNYLSQDVIDRIKALKQSIEGHRLKETTVVHFPKALCPWEVWQMKQQGKFYIPDFLKGDLEIPCLEDNSNSILEVEVPSLCL